MFDMKEYNKKGVTIRVTKDTYEKLRMLGHTPETFDDIISKLLQGRNKR